MQLVDENSRKIERLELIQKYLSILVSIASFWIITLFWNYYNFGNLALVPRLGLAAALSWDVFLHAEAIGMLIMSMIKEKWQADARDARKEAREAHEKTQAAHAETQMARLQAQAEKQMAELRAQASEAQAQLQAREAELHAQTLEAQVQLQEREAQLQAREADLRMREAELREEQLREAREREAQAQETIRDLRRRLEAAENGEGANPATA